MVETHNQEHLHDQVRKSEEDRILHARELRELFRCLDESDDGCLAQDELEKFLVNREQAEQIALQCRVPLRDVHDVMRMLFLNKDSIDEDAFVSSLLEVGNQVTEKSIMKIETHLTSIQRQTTRFLARLDKQILDAEVMTRNILIGMDDQMTKHQAYTEKMLVEFAAKVTSQQTTLQRNEKVELTLMRQLQELQMCSSRTRDVTRGLDGKLDEIQRELPGTKAWVEQDVLLQRMFVRLEQIAGMLSHSTDAADEPDQAATGRVETPALERIEQGRQDARVFGPQLGQVSDFEPSTRASSASSVFLPATAAPAVDLSVTQNTPEPTALSSDNYPINSTRK
jgi:hypothetical protein